MGNQFLTVEVGPRTAPFHPPFPAHPLLEHIYARPGLSHCSLLTRSLQSSFPPLLPSSFFACLLLLAGEGEAEGERGVYFELTSFPPSLLNPHFSPRWRLEAKLPPALRHSSIFGAAWNAYCIQYKVIRWKRGRRFLKHLATSIAHVCSAVLRDFSVFKNYWNFYIFRPSSFHGSTVIENWNSKIKFKKLLPTYYVAQSEYCESKCQVIRNTTYTQREVWVRAKATKTDQQKAKIFVCVALCNGDTEKKWTGYFETF